MLRGGAGAPSPSWNVRGGHGQQSAASLAKATAGEIKSAIKGLRPRQLNAKSNLNDAPVHVPNFEGKFNRLNDLRYEP